MLQYILKNIARHKLRLVLMFTMLILSIALVSFSLQVLFNMSQIIEDNMKDFVLKKELESVISIITMFMCVLVGFSCTMVNNTYAVIIQGRINEFKLLHNLGLYSSRIKNMLFAEISILGFLSIIIGTAMGILIANWYMNAYNLVSRKLYFEVVIYICVLAFPIFLYIINMNFNKISPAIFGSSKNSADSLPLKKQEKTNRILTFLAGSTLMLLSILVKFNFVIEYLNLENFISNEQSIRDVVFFIGAIIAFDGLIYGILHILDSCAKLLKLNSLYLAIEQNLFSFKKIKTLISSFIFATVLIVGMFGLYHSIRMTVDTYIDDNIYYSHVVMLENPVTLKQEKLLSLPPAEFSGGRIVRGLTLEALSQKGKRIAVSGIDQSYFEINSLSFINESKKDSIFEEGRELYTIMPIKRMSDEDLSIDDVSEYKVMGKSMGFKIKGEYRAYDRGQMYVSRELLSKRVFGNSDICNTLYFVDFSDSEVEKAVKLLGATKYEVKDISIIKSEYKADAVKGTEMIEAFLYINLLFTTSLIINMFLLSFQDRIRQYAILRVLGVRKSAIIATMLIEGGIIFLLGSSIGWELGKSFVKGAIMYIEDTVFFKVKYFLPTDSLALTLYACMFVLLTSTFIIAVFILRENYSEHIYKE
ncbi:MAG: FtsX-like permease family protein [Clostridia bacterium]